MSTYTQIIYHIVFGTKGRKSVLVPDKREELFRYVWGILKNKGCHLYRIGGADDHIHILTSVHPTLALARLVKDVKISSSKWIRESGAFPGFEHWQDGYGGFTLSLKEKDALIDYIKGQTEHHKKIAFKDELRQLLEEAGVEFDERFLE
jgi:REP element-mobilizing transposase RayT